MPDVGLLDVGQADGLDQLRDPNKTCPHVCGERGELRIHNHIQRLDAPRHHLRIPDMVSAPTHRSGLDEEAAEGETIAISKNGIPRAVTHAAPVRQSVV